MTSQGSALAKKICDDLNGAIGKICLFLDITEDWSPERIQGKQSNIIIFYVIFLILL